MSTEDKISHEWHYLDYRITTSNDLMDIEAIHRYLTSSSWAEGIDIETVKISVINSLCFALFDGAHQIGFARIVTDWATFGYLCDVYILDEWRDKKLGRWLMECCQQHPVVMKLRRVMLVTTTASWLYEKMGYQPVNRDHFVWQIAQPDIYKKNKSR